MNKVFLGLAFIACALLPLGAHDGPGIGLEDPAPPIRVGTWLKGAPVEQFQAGKVYVVEFWSTWCAPCKESFPLLSEMARKYAGHAQVFGVSIFERENDDATVRAQKIADFVKEMGGAMDFSVATDSPRFGMAQGWMWVADEYELPTVFVIDKDGRIAWIGRPDKGLDAMVGKVVAGTFDRKAAHEALHAKRALRKAEQDELKHLSDLWQEKKYAEALAAIDKLAIAKPAYKGGLIPFRFNLLLEADEAAAYRYAEELAAGEYKDKADNLDGMARSLCQTPSLKHPDYALALRLSKQACALNHETNFRHLATMAEVYFRMKACDQAIQTGERAIGLAKKQPDAQAALEDLQSRVDAFKAAKKKADESGAEKPKAGTN